MKMTVKEFVKLDLTSLMQVNGGTSACGNYTQTQPATPPSGGNETDNAPSNNGGGTGESANTNDTPSSYSPGYSGGSTTGTTTGTCGGSGGQTPLEKPPKTNDKPNNDTTNNNNNNGGSTSVGGCSSINGGNGNGSDDELKGKNAKEDDDVANDLPENTAPASEQPVNPATPTEPSTPPEQPSSPNSPTTNPNDGSTDNSTMENNGNNYEYQQTTNTNAPHCDIIAWNHAVDAGVDPTGEDGTVWDGNADGMNVNNIYNNYYAAGSTEFNSDLAGQSGYLFSDWRGDGSFDHMEYCTVNEDGSYTFYRNNGYENSEVLDTRFFSNDPNGQASSDGIVRFYSLTGDN